MLEHEEICELWIATDGDTVEFAHAVERAVLAKAMPIPKQEPLFIGNWDDDARFNPIIFVDGLVRSSVPNGTAIYAHNVPAQAAAMPEWMPIETMPNNRTLVQVYCEGADCVGVAHKTIDGRIFMPEPQAIGYDSLTHWRPLSASPKP